MKLPSTFSIFPVSGKKPLVDWGEYSKRLPTTEELKSWEKYKEFGIATGPISRVLVLDDDGGLDTSKCLIPKTLTQKTPRGGTHYFFKWTSELDNKVTTKVGVLKGVDVRGAGGFAVFYGFERPYWTTPLANPPKWLVDLLPNKNLGSNGPTSAFPSKGGEVNLQKSQLEELLDGIGNGNRNDTFTRIAGSLRARGYSSNDMYLLLEPKAKQLDFSLQELRLLTESVARYKPNERQTETQIRVEENDETFSFSEFLKDRKPVEWLCNPLIAKGSIAFMAGLPKVSKTWLLMDLALEMAVGGTWLNKFPVKKSKVLFIDQERPKEETQRRFSALAVGKGIKFEDLDGRLSLRCKTTTKIDLEHSFQAFRKVLAKETPDIVFIDSFVTWHTKEESNRTEIQLVMERMKSLRNEFGCAFFFIHHETKASHQNAKEGQESSYLDMSGNVAIAAAAEHIFNVRRQDSESCMMFHTANNLGDTIDPVLIKVVDQNDAKTKIKVEAY